MSNRIMTEDGISHEKYQKMSTGEGQGSTLPFSKIDKCRLTAGDSTSHYNTLDAYLPKVKNTGSGKMHSDSKSQKPISSGWPSTKAVGNHKIVRHEIESKISSNGKNLSCGSKMISPLESVSEREGKATPTKSQLTQSVAMDNRSCYDCSQPSNFNTSSLRWLLNSKTSSRNMTKDGISGRPSYKSSQAVQMSNSSSQSLKLSSEEVQEFLKTNGVSHRTSRIKAQKFSLCSCRSDEIFTYSL